MAINDLSVLISTEQDGKLVNKERSARTEESKSSANDFFEQMQSANDAVETAHQDKHKVKPTKNKDVEDKLTHQKSSLTDEESVISGDQMLAQIEAANNIDMSVKTSTDEPSTSLIEGVEQESKEVSDTDLKNAIISLPVDNETPEVKLSKEGEVSEGAKKPLAVDSNDKTPIAQAIDKHLKQNTLSEETVITSEETVTTSEETVTTSEETVTTAIDGSKTQKSKSQQVESETSVDLVSTNKEAPKVMSSLAEVNKNLIKQDLDSASVEAGIKTADKETNTPVEPIVKESKQVTSNEINQVIKSLMNVSEGDKTKGETVLSSLTPEQRSELQTKVDEVIKKGVTSQNVSDLKLTIKQFIVSNQDRNVNSVSMTNSSQLSNEIASLSQTEKQDLLKQLEQFVSTEQPQGDSLKRINTAIAELKNDKTSVSQKDSGIQIQNLDSDEAVTLKSQLGLKSEVSEQVNDRKPIVDMKINQLFTSITTAVPTATDINEAIDERLDQEFTDLQVLNTQQSNATSQAKQTNTDPSLFQALNIVKSDAAKQLQERVSALLNINNKEAEIRLDPPEMGSMHIRIRSDAEQAQINFVVQNQQAKEALEQSLPKLRDMLAEQGIELGESNIQQGDAQENNNQHGQENSQAQLIDSNQGDEQVSNSHESNKNLEKQSSSSIDYYA